MLSYPPRPPRDPSTLTDVEKEDKYSPGELRIMKEKWERWREEHHGDLRMYVLVRRDVLPLAHCVAQTSHAVAEYVHFNQNDKTSKWVEEDKTIVILKASADQIENAKAEFDDAKMNYHGFREPDMSNCITAVAFEPLTREQGKKFFGKFSLLS